MTKTVAGLCPNCGGVKVPGIQRVEEEYRPGLLFDSDDFDPSNWISWSGRALPGLMILLVIAGVLALVSLISGHI